MRLCFGLWKKAGHRMKILSDISSISGRGYTLIEASAGTGKTFTITNIFLRLIMEEGLLPEQILVVTFTRAATEELKSKLRQRIEDALLFLETEHAPDDVLKNIVNYTSGTLKIDKAEIKRRLKLALLGMDQAAVYTIHSFCQRVLKEYSLEAGTLSTNRNVIMDEELYRPACIEFIRTYLAELDDECLKLVLEVFNKNKLVSELYSAVKDLLKLPEPLVLPQITLEDVVKEHKILQKKQKKAQYAINDFPNVAKELIKNIEIDVLDELAEILSPFISGKPRTKIMNWIKNLLNKEIKALNRLIEKLLPKTDDFNIAANSILFAIYTDLQPLMKLWLFNELSYRVEFKQKNKTRGVLQVDWDTNYRYYLTLVQWLKDENRNVIIPPVVTNTISDLLSDILPIFHHFEIHERLKTAIMHEARKSIKDFMMLKKQQMKALSFDDMLTLLHKALKSDKGKHLGNILRNRYQVALIDEFQDTDSVQWDIFRTIYSDTNKSRLFLIGDPKQAIYGFRGADIFTYLKAKKSVNDQNCYDLNTNWRSAPEIVEAVNRLFSLEEQTFVLDGIDFSPVCSREENRWYLHLKDPDKGQQEDWANAIDIWLAELYDPAKIFDSTIMRRKLANINEEDLDKVIEDSDTTPPPDITTASKISEILTLSSQGKLVFKGPEGQERRVEAGDIAILVRTHRQAEEIRQALYDLGIYSIVYGPSNVFNANEARELLYILGGVLSPVSKQALSTALCTTIIGYDAEQLIEAQENNEKWNGLIDDFVELKETWEKRGVLPMLRRLFQKFNVPKKLLALQNGPRRLTNLRQLCELLADAEREQPSPSKLLLWLKKAIDNPGPDQEERRLRLETDENLVKIMTYHMSKGLEFPIVFLPYIGQYSSGPLQKNIKFYHPEYDSYVIPTAWEFVFDSHEEDGKAFPIISEEELYFAEQQNLAEEIRLAYVAITRAKYKMFLGMTSSGVFNHLLANLFFEVVLEQQSKYELENVLDQWLDYLDINDEEINSEEDEDVKLLLSNLFKNLENFPEIIKTKISQNLIQAYEEVDDILIPIYEPEPEDEDEDEDEDGIDLNEDEENSNEDQEDFDPFDPNLLWALTFQKAFEGLKRIKLYWRDDVNKIIEDAKEFKPLRSTKKTFSLPTLGPGPVAVQDWARLSFSAISASMQEGSPFELLGQQPETLDMAGFPRGAQAGNCVHKLFEEINFNDNRAEIIKVTQSVIEAFSIDEKWTEVMTDLVIKVVSTPLKPYDFSLNEIKNEHLIKEMVFYWPFKHDFLKNLSCLDITLKKGLLKGYIDLLFWYDQKFYLLDYKTNWLGNSIKDYSKENMKRAMDQHDYWLQAGIYAGAVDAYFSKIMPEYKQDIHFGGIFYLFVRGMCGDGIGDSGVLYISPKELQDKYTWLFRDKVGENGGLNK